MKKTPILLVLMLLVILSPAVALASWWNPFSWFNYWHFNSKVEAPKESQKEQVPPQSTSTPKPKGVTKPTAVLIEYKPGKNIIAKIGDTISAHGVQATLTKLVEDSRCPIGVNCIQAGTVRVGIHGTFGTLKEDDTLTLNQPYTLHEYTVTLIDVKPQKLKDKANNPNDYTFTFSVKEPNRIAGNGSGTLAQCLKDKGVKMYGASWCSHCQAQKALFGASVKDVPYVECSASFSKEQLPICTQNGITSYPTWKFKDGSELTGETSLENLAKKAGCVLNVTN